MPTQNPLISPKVIWAAQKEDVFSGKKNEILTGPWKLMLLGDGSPTRHLKLLTGFEVSVELISMDLELEPNNQAPPEVKELKPPLLKRQVWLTCGALTVAWAESWWNQQEAEKHLTNKHQPIWQSLTQGRSELFREVDGLALVNAKWLASAFQTPGPFWSRHYRFFREKQELTVIREVFSPKLEQWLGSVSRHQI